MSEQERLKDLLWDAMTELQQLAIEGGYAITLHFWNGGLRTVAGLSLETFKRTLVNPPAVWAEREVMSMDPKDMSCTVNALAALAQVELHE